MVAFGITYDSNLEFGQIIQKCECADAVVMVEPGYERDAAPIPFAATLRRMGRDNAMEDSGGEVEIWQTQKARNQYLQSRCKAAHWHLASRLPGYPSGRFLPTRHPLSGQPDCFRPGEDLSQGVDDL